MSTKPARSTRAAVEGIGSVLSAEEVRRTLKDWSNHTFVEVKNRTEMARLVRSASIDFRAGLTEEQYYRLVDTFSEFFQVYRTADFAGFKRFVKARNGSFEPRAAQYRRNPLLTRPLGEVPFHEPMSRSNRKLDSREKLAGEQRMRELFAGWKWPPESAEEIMRASWHLHYHRNPAWLGLASDDLQIRIFKSDKPFESREAGELPWSVGGAGAIWSNAYEKEAQVPFGKMSSSVLSPYGVETTGENPPLSLLARIRMVVKYPAPEPPGLQSLTFKWKRTVRNWVPFAGDRYFVTDDHSANIVIIH